MGHARRAGGGAAGDCGGARRDGSGSETLRAFNGVGGDIADQIHGDVAPIPRGGSSPSISPGIRSVRYVAATGRKRYKQPCFRLRAGEPPRLGINGGPLGRSAWNLYLLISRARGPRPHLSPRGPRPRARPSRATCDYQKRPYHLTRTGRRRGPSPGILIGSSINAFVRAQRYSGAPPELRAAGDGAYTTFWAARAWGGDGVPSLESSRTSPKAFASLSQKAIRTGRPAPSKSSKVFVGDVALAGVFCGARIDGEPLKLSRESMEPHEDLGEAAFASARGDERAATSFAKMGQARPPYSRARRHATPCAFLASPRAVLSSVETASPNMRAVASASLFQDGPKPPSIFVLSLMRSATNDPSPLNGPHILSSFSVGFLSQTLFRAALSLNVITTKTRVSVISRSHFRASQSTQHRSSISKITMATSPQSQATCLLSFAWKAVARVIVFATAAASSLMQRRPPDDA